MSGLKSINLVLSILSVNLLTVNQCENLGISLFKVLISSLGSLFEKNRFVTSAKRITLASDETLQMSFIYIRKNKERKIDPCGTPQFIFSREEAELLN